MSIADEAEIVSQIEYIKQTKAGQVWFAAWCCDGIARNANRCYWRMIWHEYAASCYSFPKRKGLKKWD